MQAITAATLDSAKALHVDDERGSIAVGKLADLVLVEGAPHKKISDIERISRVFLGGHEIDRERLARDIASAEQTMLAAVKVEERIDDFENVNDERRHNKKRGDEKLNDDAGDSSHNTHQTHADSLRSDLGTLWVNSTDAGHDHSQIIFGRTLRKERDHALSVLARMSTTAERPFVRVSVPLARGAIEPADARRFRGIRFRARGDGGDYRLIVPTRGVRNSVYFQAPFKAESKWKTVEINFASLRQEETKTPAAWTGTDLLMLSFEVARPSGELGWLELDDLRFYR